MSEDPTLLEITTEDEIIELKYKTEKHDHQKILKSFKIDDDFYKKKCKSLNEKKILLIITEFFRICFNNNL